MTNPTNLNEYYQSKGQQLPSVSDRAPLAKQAGIVDPYIGSEQQNIKLLSYLNGGGSVTPPVTPGPAIPTQQTPAPTDQPTSSTATKAQATDTGGEQGLYHTQPGDKLEDVAKKYNTNIQAFMKENTGIKNPNALPSNMYLKIPGAPTGSTSQTPANQYQSSVQSAVNGVSDQSNVAAVRGAAATVPYNDDNLPPDVNQTISTLIPSLIDNIQKAFSPEQSGQTLVEEYKSFSKDLGIEELSTKYMNLEKVINGTENDIRSEVTKSGGFMSESQVQALTASRNKVLITQANTLQQQITNKQNTLDTMIGLESKDKDAANARIENATNLSLKLVDMQQTMQKNAADAYNKIVTNTGYSGLAGALKGDPYSQALAEKALMLPPGTLSNPSALAKLETYRQQSIAQGATRINIQSGTADALTVSRYSTAINSTIRALYPTNKNPIQTYNQSSQSINRIDQSYQDATDSKNPNKAAADLDLLDSYISIARGGQPITEAQVDVLLKGMGITAKFDTATQKFTGSAILNNGNRKSLYDLSHQIYDGQKDLAEKARETINERLGQIHIPDEYQFHSLEEVGDTSSYSGGLSFNGQYYSSGSVIGTVNGVTLTANPEGTLSGSDGHTYDSEGNEIN